MTKRWIVVSLWLASFCVVSGVSAQGPGNYDAKWMWHNAGNPADNAPDGKVWAVDGSTGASLWDPAMPAEPVAVLRPPAGADPTGALVHSLAVSRDTGLI